METGESASAGAAASSLAGGRGIGGGSYRLADRWCATELVREPTHSRSGATPSSAWTSCSCACARRIAPTLSPPRRGRSSAQPLPASRVDLRWPAVAAIEPRHRGRRPGRVARQLLECVLILPREVAARRIAPVLELGGFRYMKTLEKRAGVEPYGRRIVPCLERTRELDDVTLEPRGAEAEAVSASTMTSSPSEARMT